MFVRDGTIGKQSNSRIRVSSYRSTNTPAKAADTPSRPWYAERKRRRAPSVPGPISNGSSRSPPCSPPEPVIWRCGLRGRVTSVKARNGCARNGNTSSTTTTIDARAGSAAGWPPYSPFGILNRMERMRSGRREKLNESSRSGVILGDAGWWVALAARGLPSVLAPQVRRHEIPKLNSPTAESNVQV